MQEKISFSERRYNLSDMFRFSLYKRLWRKVFRLFYAVLIALTIIAVACIIGNIHIIYGMITGVPEPEMFGWVRVFLIISGYISATLTIPAFVIVIFLVRRPELGVNVLVTGILLTIIYSYIFFLALKFSLLCMETILCIFSTAAIILFSLMLWMCYLTKSKKNGKW